MKKSEEYIKEWIAKISEVRPELGNFAVCPYSHSATYKIIEVPIDDIIPIDGCDIVIFVVEDYLDVNAIQMWCEIYNTIYPELVFLEDCANYHTFLNGVQTNNGKYNLILCQSKAKLHEKREILAKTRYYAHWNDAMMQEILGNDYTTVKNAQKTNGKLTD